MDAKSAVTMKLPALEPEVASGWRQTIPSKHPPGQTLRAGGAAPSAIDATVFPSGIRLGPELGRGGFGLINAATQEVFGRRVAVKRLLSEYPDDARRFRAEAIVTANLQHPNVVPIHDLGRDGDGRLQLVMKVIEGDCWADLLHPKEEHSARAAAMTTDDHLDILLKVCDAVEFAHDRGILHRDLKPDNVMVGAFGEVQVMDWGCAVAFGSARQHELIPRAERVSDPTGTPAYMAPEMALGRGDAIGPHTDVFLLGSILYEILTGDPPHMAPSAHAALVQAAECAIKPPNEAAPDAGIPDELAWIAMAALARDPAERTPTVARFARQVREFRSHEQAMRLASNAKHLIGEARKRPEQAEELLRRAMATADNAVELWPERAAGLKVQFQATYAYARHALARADFAAASSTAGRAAEMAKALRSENDARAAADTVATARAALAAQAGHERHVRVLRIALAAAGAVVLVGLVVGITAISAQHRKTRAALDQTQEALQKLQAEQESRRADQRRSAPGLVAEAQQLAGDKRLPDAERIAAIAVDFDPELADGHALLACLLAGRGDFAGAHKESGEWQRVAPTDADAPLLARLCDRAAMAGKALPPDLTIAFGELFARRKLVTLAESRMLTPEQRANFYRDRIEAAWKGAGAGLDLQADGTLRLAETDSRASLKGRADVTDLRPLAGMPLSNLSLADTGAFDLSPLAGAPLITLSLAGSKVRDLAPLARCPTLESLNISETEVADLGPLAGTKLKWLRADADTALTDLSPLARTPLQALTISGTRVRDLSPLADCKLRQLIATGCVIADWSAVRGFPLRDAQLNFSTFDDRALAALPPQEVESLAIAGSRVTDLVPVRAMPKLTQLVISGLPISDPAPLAGLPIRTLAINETKVADLTMLRTMHQLKELDVSGTPIKNYWTLSGLRLARLSIARTKLTELSALDVTALADLTLDGTLVGDLSPLHAAPLTRLSLRDTPATDLGPLAGVPLVTLDVGGSRIASLKAISGATTLRELAVDHLPINDYRPITTLPLERLIIGPFTRSRTCPGLDELRMNPHLKVIGVYSLAKKTTQAWSPSEFWRKLDAGELSGIE
jgi:Leucine-rich repeat (LRR) protein